MSDWWQRIEQDLDERSAAAPDPWADRASDEAVALTTDQQRYLVENIDLSDQPAVARLSELLAELDTEADAVEGLPRSSASFADLLGSLVAENDGENADGAATNRADGDRPHG